MLAKLTKTIFIVFSLRVLFLISKMKRSLARGQTLRKYVPGPEQDTLINVRQWQWPRVFANGPNCP